MKMSKTQIAKYRITDTNIDKEIIGKQVTVEKIRAKGGRVGPTTKKQKSTRDLLIEFMNRQDKFNKSIRLDLNRVIKLNNLKH